ncbi:AEC family transporter [Telmatospirillum siberiense]|uniref:AEC family transporter n=1 Tax=Telmatospirillum siberiense TaxID=382514 RepID=A0A2N3PXW6_9PROT|nr:AEC family transporter [Telmatospirillum siberiense]PKU25248.1 AEC family transporter [Telmatospirillum siberiense]
MHLITNLAAVIAPAFLISLAGYLWARRGLPFDQTMITHMITLIGAPCLVFSIFTKMRMSGAAFATMGGASTACLVLFGVAGAIGLRAAGLSSKVYLPSLIFPNVGNMGIPICLFAFGEQGMALAMVYFAVTIIGQFTIGVALASGEFRIGALLRLPFIYVTVIALALNAFEVRPPAWLTNTADVAGGLTVPLMLMALGVALAQLKVDNVGRAVAMSLVRLLLGGAGGWLVARLFGLEGAALGVLVVQSAMPVAVFNYLFASLYHNEPEEVAGMVLVSTALAYLGLPLLVAALT